MTITPWTIYWISRLDGLQELFQIGGIFLLVLGGLVATTLSISVIDEGLPRKFLLFWIAPIVGLVAVCISVMIPTKNEMAAILVIPKIVNNEKVAAMPSKIVDLATEWLDHLKPSAK